MRKLKKRILTVLGILLVLFVLAVVGVFLYIDVIAKRGIEVGTSYALGVDASVDDVSLSLFGGQLDLDTMSVGNPDGYETPHLMKFERLAVEVVPGSLWTDTIVVSKFEIDDLDINIEQKIGTSNVSEVLEHVRKITEKEEETKEKPKGRQLQIDTVRVRNVVVHVQVLPIVGKAIPLEIKIPEIRMDNVTPEGSKGMMIGELVRNLFPAIMASVLDKGRGILPDDLTKDIAGKVGGVVKALGGHAAELVGQVGGRARDLIEKSAGGVFEGIRKGTGGLLDGVLRRDRKDKTNDEDKP